MPNTKYNEKKNYQKEHRICLPYKSRHFFHVIESMQKKVSCMYIYLSIYIFFNEVLGYFLQCQKTVTVMFSVWLCLDQGFIGPCVLKYTHWQSSSYCKSYFFIPVLKTCFLPGALEVIMQTPSPKLSELLRAEKSTVQLSV